MRQQLRASKNFSEFLLHEYLARRERNPRYSYRAFARDTGLSVSHLSSVFNRKNGVSRSMIREVAAALKLTSFELEYVWNLIQRDFSRSEAMRKHSEQKLKEMAQAFDSGQVSNFEIRIAPVTPARFTEAYQRMRSLIDLFNDEFGAAGDVTAVNMFTLQVHQSDEVFLSDLPDADVISE